MISLRFFGTGALDSFRIKNKLSKEYRRFSTLLIDEKLIIDPSEDIFEFIETFMLQGILDDVNDVFITHSHIDHFSITAIERLASNKRIRVYASSAMKDEILSIKNVDYIEIYPFAIQKIGKYTVLPLPANHKTDIPYETTLNYLIECDEKKLFYGLDGAFVNPSAVEILGQITLDAVVLDCALGTDGYSAKSANHNNLDMVRTIYDIFVASGTANDSTKFILSHIPALKKRFMHEEMCEATLDSPFKVAYDGYFVGI